MKACLQNKVYKFKIFYIHVDICYQVLLCKFLGNCIKQNIFYNIRQAFAMTNNMASSGLREKVIFTKIILTTDGTNGCVKSDTWCQRGVWYSPVHDHTYQCCWFTQAVHPPALCLAGGRCGGQLIRVLGWGY